MAKLSVKKGTTSKLLDIFIQDSSSTTGAGLTGLVYNTASLTAYFYREGAAGATAITLATMTLGTWATGGFVVIDGTNMAGCYQLGIPDAALATGANSVIVMLKGAANMAPLLLEIELVDNVEADTYAIVNNATYGNSALDTDLNTLLTESQSHPTLAEIEATTVLAKEATLTPIQSDTNDIQARIPTALVGGRMDSSVGSNIDKTGYTLSAAGIQAIWDALTSALTTAGSIGKLLVDNINATISSRSSHAAADVWSVTTRTLTSFGTLIADIWANTTRTLTSFGTLIADIWANTTRTLTSVGGIKKNTAFNNFDFLMVDSTDHVTGETGLTVTAQRSINGGAFAACANAVSELANGKYLINLAASDLNGDIVALRFTATGADTRNITIITTP